MDETMGRLVAELARVRARIAELEADQRAQDALRDAAVSALSEMGVRPGAHLPGIDQVGAALRSLTEARLKTDERERVLLSELAEAHDEVSLYEAAGGSSDPPADPGKGA